MPPASLRQGDDRGGDGIDGQDEQNRYQAKRGQAAQAMGLMHTSLLLLLPR